MKIEVLCSPGNLLGECPLWCERTRRLYWVDGRAPAFHVHDSVTCTTARHPLPETTGSICLCEDGSLLVAMVTGIFRLSPEGVVGARVADAPGQHHGQHQDNRFNDGRCDRAGRFFCGTMNDRARIPTGALYRLDAAGALAELAGDIIVPNSLAFSPDDSRLYFADTYRHVIHTFEYDIESGAISHRRLFADLQGGAGRPDGSAVDAEGCLWNAEYAGGRIVRYTPDGRIDRIVELPVSQPTCCAFGGAALDELYITSASQRLTPEQAAAQPLAGSVFVVRPGVQGLPEGRYAG